MRASDVLIGDIIVTPDAVYGVVDYIGDRAQMLETGIINDTSSSIWLSSPQRRRLVTDLILKDAEVWSDQIALSEGNARRLAEVQTAVRMARDQGLSHTTPLVTAGFKRIHPERLWWKRLLARLWS